MSEYMFGVTAKVTKTEGRRRDKIARKHGGTFVGPLTIPGESGKGWFAIPNLGDPFNRKREREILSACGLD